MSRSPGRSPAAHTAASDVAFTAAFGLEALLKIFAFSFRTYISSGVNKVGW